MRNDLEARLIQPSAGIRIQDRSKDDCVDRIEKMFENCWKFFCYYTLK